MHSGITEVPRNASLQPRPPLSSLNLYSISALTTVLLRPNIQLDVIGIR